MIGEGDATIGMDRSRRRDGAVNVRRDTGYTHA
jgi:hypothetical protein